MSKVHVIAILAFVVAVMEAHGTALSRLSRNAYPPARRIGQVDELHGLRVPDPYRWMEQADSPETQAWVRAQDELLRSFIDQEAARKRIEARIHRLNELDLYPAAVIKRGGRYFFLKIDAGKSTPVLQLRDSTGTRVLFDTAHHYAQGEVRIVSYTPSNDGKAVVCGISEQQSSWITLLVLSAESGKEIGRLGQVHMTSGPVVWNADSSGFFYTTSERERSNDANSAVKNPRIFYHLLGQQQSADQLVYSRPNMPAALFNYSVSDDGRYFVIEVRDGSARQAQVLYKDLKEEGSEIAPLISTAEADFSYLGSNDTRIYFYTDLTAPRGRVLAIDVRDPARGNWKEIVPQFPESIAGRSSVGGNAIGMYHQRLVLMYLKHGRPFLRIFDINGKLQHEVTLPVGGSIWGGFSGSPEDKEVFYQYLGMADPSTIYSLNVLQGSTSVFLRSQAQFDPNAYEVQQVFYTSKDGVRVPMLVAHRKGIRLDGSHPTWMYAYGAFGWVSFIWYQPHLLTWLDMGGIYAIPAVRGGGEYGEEWHAAGIKSNRQNAIDDFLYAAKWLIANRYTSRKLLVGNGGSASGGLAAAALLQDPESFGAVVIDRPVLDLVRFDQFTQGRYWASEFGSPQDPKEFRSLYAYSPYHHFKNGVCYPPTLVMSGNKDQTAVPAHAYKFTAAMQAAQGCGNPIMLQVMWGAGHNFGSTPQQTVQSWTDAMSFLVKVLKLQVPKEWGSVAPSASSSPTRQAN